MRPFCQILIRATRWDSNPLRHDPEAVRNVLREIRLHHQLSQEELAARLSVNRKTVDNWENNRTVPHPLHVKALIDLQKGLIPPGRWDSSPVFIVRHQPKRSEGRGSAG